MSLQTSSYGHLDISNIKSSCATCSLRELCLPVGLNSHEIQKLGDVVSHKRKIPRGGYLHHTGTKFQSLFAIRSGFLKTCVLEQDGRQQVTGFHMTGELLGLDAISSEIHTCDAVALEDSEVCEIPFAKLEEISLTIPSLMHHFHKIMSREIVRDHGVMLLLGSMKAEERLATFLLNLSRRFSIRGYSEYSFNLRMTREEIGSYLGLKLETVSRAFSKLQDENIITVDNKHIQINDMNRLKLKMGNSSCVT
ncbi:fumarate/nitrate reduction transcriptional regulator Fnr [Nitrosomonas sp. JL21]|uniref:fumarate/nitrate reduction transcriptional regulator Fnr n=1 Tax=Nitrosomonas sp. JL21 TaxID=153949 RepID=UPI001370CCFC|nr:fumarate/nitrate reduction transcriptional regulator Fnr [Nitrosomonas sp. JL21]MBL8496614.1 fumarate/nitrate reduction transcriptional regulator Fnr [Nitrosomonas sp.]MCC7092498.1 fumarate/nitrate reduction transcriptional regulator Fnr [Nitrosomonas sp.]MXS76471.1 fumarate/nitrate reduction transcriptional regulator Fnr [Nitrosomonas sp. JL21]